ncbi:PAS domain S-box protein [Litchfieldia salsa]|uniref:histidine kinase n=1 Tax=Litchfieldia salsa TaxID=930152 RepID=A0A1H0WX54_9BACI|nr:PAS domain S-box protein [Litchfieldia salsa]SDP94806.1 two-component system, sporulation sensor kinase A [Litchfieldia salsa]
MNTTQRIGDLRKSFIALNEDLEIIYCNTETETIFNLPVDFIIGKEIFEMIPDMQFSSYIKELISAIHNKSLLQFQEYIPQLNRWLEFSTYPGMFGSNIFIVDITHEVLKDKILVGQKLILEKITTGKPLIDVLHKIVEFIEGLLGSGYCSVLLPDKSGECLQVRAAPSLPESFVQKMKNIRIGPNSVGCGKAAYLKEKVFTSDFMADPLYSPVMEEIKKADLKSCWSIPILDSEEKLLGTFAIYYEDVHRLNEINLQLIELSCYLCSIAIAKERTYQQKASDTEVQYSIIAENMTDLIKVVDKNFIVQYCSPSVKSLLGFEVEEIVESQSLYLIHPEDISKAVSVCNQVFATKLNQKIEYRTRNSEGKWIYFEAVLSPFNHKDGQVEQVLIVSRDISERKQSERIRKQREQRYKSLFMHNPDGVYSLDLNGRFVKINDELLKITGYSRSELIQMESPLFIMEEDHNRVCTHFQKALKGDSQHYELTIQQKGGKKVYLNVKNMPIRVDGEIVGVYGIAKDVTEQQEALEALEKSEMKFRSVVESASEGIIITDEELKILSWNKGAEAIFGYTSEEAIGENLALAVSKEFLKKYPKLSKQFVSKPYESYVGKAFELKGCTKSGEETPLEVSLNYWQTGDKKYISAIIRDISDRKKAEHALQKSEEKYRRLIENLPEAMIIINEKRLMFANKKVVELFGTNTKEELYRHSIFDIIDPDYHFVIDEIKGAICEKYVVENMEVRFVTPSGGILDVQVNAVPTIYEGEKAAQIILRDITELKRSKELLLNAEKLSAAGELAAGIAHEIRNPLTSIKGFIQLANTSDLNQERYFPIILTEIERINSIISELLLLAKPKKTEFKKMSFRASVLDMLKLYSPQAILHNIELIEQIEVDDSEIIGHESKLKQVFINLFKNALEAMPNGGALIIQLKGNHKSLTLTIKDNGQGIPAKVLPKLGQPFFTTKEKGTGLGLATCFSIIENHKGTMVINSEENKGTEIKITLPRLIVN